MQGISYGRASHGHVPHGHASHAHISLSHRRVPHRCVSSLNLTTDRMQPFYPVVRTYLRLLVVAGISRFGAKSALAVLSGSPTAAGTEESLALISLAGIWTTGSSSSPCPSVGGSITDLLVTCLTAKVFRSVLGLSGFLAIVLLHAVQDRENGLIYRVNCYGLSFNY